MTKDQLTDEIKILKKQIKKMEQGKSKLSKIAKKTPDDTMIYKELADSISDVFFSMDKDLRYTYWNKASKKLTGISPKEAIGKTIYELFPDSPETKKAAQVYLQAIKTKKPKKFINKYQRKGKNYIFEINAYPLKNGVSVFVKDITEQKLTEEALINSELRFRNCFDLPLIGFAITSPVKGWIEVNERICSILGYSRDEIVQMTWSELTHPDDLATDIEQFNLILSGQIEKYSMDKRFICKDGQAVWTSISVCCVRQPDGGVDYIIGLMEDISERKQVEEALQESEEKYRLLFEAETDAILVLDAESKRFNDANNSALNMLGYSREEFLTLRLRDITAEPEESEKTLQKILTGELTRVPERYYRKKDGTVFPVEVSAGTFNLKGRQIVIGAVRDISKRKKADQKLLEKMSELERLNRLFMGREERMIDLKREVNSLLEKQGQPKKYQAPDKIERRHGSRIQGH